MCCEPSTANCRNARFPGDGGAEIPKQEFYSALEQGVVRLVKIWREQENAERGK